MMRAIRKSFGVYTALTPASVSRWRSSSGMMPPTMTGASTPSARSMSTIEGTSERCEPLRIDRPITSGSSSRAEATICSGVRRMPLYTTSMPASRAATAICSAPLLCPSRPGLATRKRTGPPTMERTNSATAASSPTRRPTAAFTPVGARNSPNTSRNAADHSPVVPPAFASSIDGYMMFVPSTAAACSAERAASTAT